jgi:SAM-dependent methyltransferase
MAASKAGRTYRLLAEHYDSLFSFAHSWGLCARGQLLADILPNVNSACDLACGTGRTALELARLGIRVCAVDASPTMVRSAREKVAASGLPVTVIRADMRKFRLPEPVDLITCEFDAINHIPEKSDLALVAECAAKALRPGGYFYFDSNNRSALEEVWPLTWRMEKPGVVLVMHGEYDPERERAHSTADFFLKRGRLWERHQEHVDEICWTQEEVRKTLRAAGFEAVTARDASPFFPPDSMIGRGHRTIYLARRKRKF